MNPCLREMLCPEAGIRSGKNLVLPAPYDLGRNRDSMQPFLKGRIERPWLPRQFREGVSISYHHVQLLTVRLLSKLAFGESRIEVKISNGFLRRPDEYVPHRTPADLDSGRRYQAQALNAGSISHG